MCKGMRRFKRRQYTLQLCEFLKSSQRFIIFYRNILNAFFIKKIGVFRPYARIIEPGRNRMRFLNLTMSVLQKRLRNTSSVPKPAVRERRRSANRWLKKGHAQVPRVPI